MFPIFLFIFLSFALSAEENHEFFVKPPIVQESDDSVKTYEEYLDSLKIPNLIFEQKCITYGLLINCSFTIKSHMGSLILSDPLQPISSFIKARYKYKAIGVAIQRYIWGSINTATLVDSNGNKVTLSIPDKLKKSKTIFPLPDGNLLYVSQKNLYIVDPSGNVIRIINLPVEIEHFSIGYNIDGNIAFIAISKNDLIVHNLEHYVVIKNAMKYYSDRKGILSAFPESRKIGYFAVYKYINEYTKGIYLYKINFLENRVMSEGFVFLSPERNVGFDPQIYKDIEGNIVIYAKDSTNNKLVFFVLNDNDTERLITKIPTELAYEKNLELHLSLQSGYYNIIGKTSLPSPLTYEEDISVSYKFRNNLFYGVSFAGRLGRYQLAIGYLESKIKEKVKDERSRVIIGLINMHEFIKPYWTVRIGYEAANFVGELEASEFFPDTTKSLKAKYRSIYTHLIFERGLYMGLNYLKSIGPGIFAIAKRYESGKLKALFYLSDQANIEAFMLTFGYDSLSYTRRYETNISKFYFSGEIGLGLGAVKLPDYDSNIIRSYYNYPLDKKEFPIYVCKVKSEIGFLLQRRLLSLKGGGFIFNIGYKGDIYYFGDDSCVFQTGSSSILHVPEEGGLASEFEKRELIHGPFLQLNIIF